MMPVSISVAVALSSDQDVADEHSHHSSGTSQAVSTAVEQNSVA